MKPEDHRLDSEGFEDALLMPVVSKKAHSTWQWNRRVIGDLFLRSFLRLTIDHPEAVLSPREVQTLDSGVFYPN